MAEAGVAGVLVAVEFLQHLVFTHEAFLLLLNISLEICKLILINLLFELNFAAFLEDFIVLVLSLFEALLVPFFQLQLLVLIFTELATHLDQILLQLLDGFLEHGDLLLLHRFILGHLFAQP